MKTWPRCAAHRVQEIDSRTMPKLVSVVFVTFMAEIGCQKLGQPVPDSNLASELNKARSQPIQAKIPLRCSLSKGLEPGRSVAARHSTF